ncbi:DUF2695 domain-containing protein [Alloalcanivorax mobilis]|uniref:DUF2695 domain-containing protein n=1 Tax=Alloalcanivorax mobilis TaxID=2019569 RepID=UPI000B5B46C4|nr:DUF2695 domain-containing protein [Alloalcanivorax mobilis]ASK33314.1 hypothetical protein CEK62_02375 [Alcanivorax sp. N3-2A]|tara:strand:- start:102464 stop:102775 length:312 start_codon:yes stop_codon:yes gene_type:complete
MDKARKKSLKQKARNRQRAELEASLPLSAQTLKSLFSELDADGAPPCDHTLTRTREFLHRHGHDVAAVEPWLNQHGGFCDCEVLANVYDEVGDLLGWHLDRGT